MVAGMNGISKVLVTGGCGFIGSHVVEALVTKGCKVGVLDNLSTGSISNLDSISSKVEMHKGDIQNYDFVIKAVSGYDAIIHEAALVSVSRSVENPRLVSMVNAEGTLNLLWAAVKAKIKRFVYASSSSVYGESEALPKVETMVTRPISPYGVSKLAGENYCVTFAKVYGLHTTSLRYFNVYGPRQKAGLYSGVVPIFIGQIAKGEPPTIYGDGEQSRDFTYVEDVVQGNLLALERDTKGGEVFNVAAGKPVTVNRLASLIAGLEGKADVVPKHLEARPGDIRHSHADIAKARELLGFTPRVSIEEGLQKVVSWMLKG